MGESSVEDRTKGGEVMTDSSGITTVLAVVNDAGSA